MDNPTRFIVSHGNDLRAFRTADDAEAYRYDRAFRLATVDHHADSDTLNRRFDKMLSEIMVADSEEIRAQA